MKSKRFKFAVFGVLALIVVIVGIVHFTDSNSRAVSGIWVEDGFTRTNFNYYTFSGSHFTQHMGVVPFGSNEVQDMEIMGAFSIRNDKIEFTHNNGSFRYYSFRFGRDDNTIYIGGNRFQRHCFNTHGFLP